MRKYLFSCIVFCLLVGAVFSQEHRTKNSAVLVNIGGLDNLGPQNYEGGVGLLVNLKKVALRPSFNINSGSEKDDNSGAEESTFGFGVGCDVLKYLSDKRINPYFGGGVRFGSEKTKVENGLTTETTISDFALRGIVGVEIFLIKNVALSLEYHLTYTSTSTDIDNGLAKSAFPTSENHEGHKTELEFNPAEAFISIFILCDFPYL